MKSRDYHNEIDPYAAQWTRNLMKKGLIPDGFVDERDIRDVQPMDLWGFTRCHFFSGIAGWAYALRLAGVPDDFPLWTGSCPCQPFSVAGQQKGFADERHLWPIWAKLIAQSRPAIVLGEQVASAAAWLRLVRSDLEAMGYAVGAIPVEAASTGAYHLRDRFWFVAYSESEQARSARQPWQCGDVGGGNLANPPGARPFPTTLASVHRREEGVGSRHVDVERLGLVFGADGKARRLQSERTDQQPTRPDGVADTDATGRSVERSGGLFDRERAPQRHDADRRDEILDWVVGADGKLRRVKSGVRLLAHGVFARASKLRAYGNAIDLRPAAAFIEAALACRP